MSGSKTEAGDVETGSRVGSSAVVDTSRSPRWWRRLRWVLKGAFGIGLASAIVILTALIHYTLRIPDPMSFRQREAAPVVKVLARDGSLLAERGRGAIYISLDELPRHLVDAVVATEDRRFFEHSGLDPMGLIRAFFANMRAGRYVQGGSTLTQQLAKNLFLSPDRTIWRKAEELVLAFWLEVRLPKQDILELYLNRVYFGGGAYGVEAAAQRYFGKSARDLTLAESAVLAGLLKAPSRFSPTASQPLARARGRVVLAKMSDAGLIDQPTQQAAERVSVRFADSSAGRGISGVEYAVEFVLERLPHLTGTGTREIIVETTIDADLQRKAQLTVERALSERGAELNAGQAALVILDTDGGIRALVGGRSYQQSQYNRAIKAQRQPGSAFKPFVYLTMIESGAKPDTVVADTPLTVGDWTPRNEDGKHRGTITLRQGLAQSINTVAVRLLMEAGATKVVETARRLGLKSELRPDPSLALGTSEVTLMDMTGAFGVLATGGVRIEPHAIRAVRSGQARDVYRRALRPGNLVVAPDHVGLLTSMLVSAVKTGTGRRAELPRFPTAGKTGTTQDFRDAWFIGFTAHLIGGVWVGNDGGEPMRHVTGGGLPATLWRDVMAEAHKALLPAPLPGVEQEVDKRILPKLKSPLARRERAGREAFDRDGLRRVLSNSMPDEPVAVGSEQRR